MDKHEIKDSIKNALNSSLCENNFSDSAQKLLDVLGYKSGRTLAHQTGDVDEFIGSFPAPSPRKANERNHNSDEMLFGHADSVRLLFQFTSGEIKVGDKVQISLRFSETGDFDEGRVESFLFLAVELKADSYARGKYAQLTREINRRFLQPVVVLFKTTSNLLTLAFVHRREHKLNPERDVLGKVSLIREIDRVHPHRAHLDILSELSLSACLSWMDSGKQQHNFDGLLAAWLAKLDTDKLNWKFYGKLLKWFHRAVQESRFPQDEAKKLPEKEHIIRLITRILFVWFIKEKGLVTENLFSETKIEELLVDYDSEAGDSYYRAVLQNLFFATLNTEIDKRGFSKKQNVTHRNFSMYRYRREIRSDDKLLVLFTQTPFINGGLFDCLDSEEGMNAGGYRIDCFSDVHYEKLSIPNRLFFDKYGLFPLLCRYKFTVEENTPIEQEVALDPELLGRVFESLLAEEFNPETIDVVRKKTKPKKSNSKSDKSNLERKQTGSYYTPRSVVDYMVDEALVASLSEKAMPEDGDMNFWQERLRYLLDYKDACDDAHELFKEEEAESIVKAVAELKVLDPAVGSGAFPMGILHKLTLLLKRIDPDNRHWQALQRERVKKKTDEAFDTGDQQERDAELLEISEIFERYSSDFGRKLYLIQNSIFGVDIQPVACQIAKLRFFISLAIEQKPDREADNFGIKPLPNLETNFVIANTLLGLERQTQGQRTIEQNDEAIKRLEQQLNENRERHFHATTRKQKLACKKDNKKLRWRLAKELEEVMGFSTDTARKIAYWNAYDQNDQANWFDPKYMFGVTNGFDIVIGNPPYIQLQKDGGELGKLYENSGYKTFEKTGDVYQLFYERAFQLMKPKYGLLCFISSNSWMNAKYGKKLRSYFCDRHTPLKLLKMGKNIFESAIVDTNILLIRNGKTNETRKAVDMDRLPSKNFPPEEKHWGELRLQGEEPWMVLSAIEQGIMDKVKAAGTPLKEWDIDIYYGIKTGCNDAFIIDEATKDALVAADPNSIEILKPILRGRDIKRYQAHWAELWLNATFHITWTLTLDAIRQSILHLLSYRKDQTGTRQEFVLLLEKSAG